MIDTYFRSILAVLKASPVVQSHDITFDKRGPSAGYVRGGVCGSMVFRYDNTPHFPALSSFPHHKHLSDGTSVVACAAPTLAQILAEIESLIPG